MTLASIAALSILGQTSPALSQTKIVNAAVFQNGAVLAVHRLIIPASGEALVEDAPKGAMGTVWVYGNEGDILRVVMTKVLRPESSDIPVTTMIDALKENIGKSMEIEYTVSTQLRVVSGVLTHLEGEIAIIKSENGRDYFVPVKSILTFNGETGMNDKRSHSTQLTIPVLKISGKPGASVNIMALQSGMNWVPAYSIDMSDPTRLRITAKATIINDLGDLDEIDSRLITGYPNLLNGGGLDPLTASQYLGNSGGRSGASESMGTTGTTGTTGAFGVPRDGAVDHRFSDVQDGFLQEDIFVTPISRLLLKKGDRGYFVLFNEEAKYEHVYTLNIAGEYDRDLNVLHQIEFNNETKQPWGAATAIIMQNGQLIGSDRMSYTPIGKTATLTIAQAKEIVADGIEEEVERVRGALKDREGEPTHDLVTVKGTVIVSNGKVEDVLLKMTKQVTGEVISATDSLKISKTAKRLNQVNPTTVIQWRPTMKKGEKRTFEYTYKVYVASN